MHLWKLIALMESYSIFANGGPKVPSGFGFQVIKNRIGQGNPMC